MFDYALLIILFIGGLILVPVFRSAREMSLESSCWSNLLEVSRASTLYAADYDEVLPPVYTFDPATGGGDALLETLHEYLGQESKHCPSDDKGFRVAQVAGIEGSGKLGYDHDLGIARFFNAKTPGARLISLSGIPDPAETPFFRDPIRDFSASPSGITARSPHGDRFVGTSFEGHIMKLRFDGKRFSREVKGE